MRRQGYFIGVDDFALWHKSDNDSYIFWLTRPARAIGVFCDIIIVKLFDHRKN